MAQKLHFGFHLDCRFLALPLPSVHILIQVARSTEEGEDDSSSSSSSPSRLVVCEILFLLLLLPSAGGERGGGGRGGERGEVMNQGESCAIPSSSSSFFLPCPKPNPIPLPPPPLPPPRPPLLLRLQKDFIFTHFSSFFPLDSAHIASCRTVE